MRLLETSPADRVKVKNMLSLLYSFPFDPVLDYRIEAIGAPDVMEFKDVILELGAHKKTIQFSALNPSRKRVAELIMREDQFPPNEFCSPSPKVVMQFLRGHRLPTKKGHTGTVCILRDSSSKKANSPSVVNVGDREAAQSLNAYLTSSNSVELLAVLKVTLTEVGNKIALSGEQKGKLKGRRRRGLKSTYLAKEIDDKTYRQVRKLRDKRMDNFGIKDDF